MRNSAARPPVMNTIEELRDKIHASYPEAAEVLDTLPPAVIRHVLKRYTSDKILAAALLSVSDKSSIKDVAFRFGMPEKTVQRVRADILRNLRAYPVQPAQPTQSDSK